MKIKILIAILTIISTVCYGANIVQTNNMTFTGSLVASNGVSVLGGQIIGNGAGVTNINASTVYYPVTVTTNLIVTGTISPNWTGIYTWNTNTPDGLYGYNTGYFEKVVGSETQAVVSDGGTDKMLLSALNVTFFQWRKSGGWVGDYTPLDAATGTAHIDFIYTTNWVHLGTASTNNTIDFKAYFEGIPVTNNANISALINDANYTNASVTNAHAALVGPQAHGLGSVSTQSATSMNATGTFSGTLMGNGMAVTNLSITNLQDALVATNAAMDAGIVRTSVSNGVTNIYFTVSVPFADQATGLSPALTAVVQNASLLTNWPTSFTPYVISYAVSNDIALANGNYQYYAPTNTTTIYMPTSDTNHAYSIRIDVNPGANSFSFGTNNLCFTTNDIIGMGASTIRIRTTETTPLIFDKAIYNVNWRVFSL